MHTPAYFAFPQGWNAQDLANAMPRRLRLSRLIDFDAMRECTHACANTTSRASRAPRRGYLPKQPAPPLFRIR